jgi:hypothetical protein
MAITDNTFAPRNKRSWLLLALSAGALVLALIALFRQGSEPKDKQITLTAGLEGTARTLFARLLAAEIAANGVDARIVPAATTLEIYRRVDAREVDFAIVNGALDLQRYTHVREVMSLYQEALHLLVKPELAESVEHSFTGLRGHTVNLGPTGSATAGLANAVLDLAGIKPAAESPSDGYFPRQIDLDQELAAFVENKDRNVLPDALFHLATQPSTSTYRYVRTAGYRLVPVPFANALRMSAVYMNPLLPLAEGEVERHNVFETIISPYTYQVEPPVPARALSTIGTPVYLITHESVAKATVEGVMDAVLNSRFARMHEPPIDRSVLSSPARIALHPGSIRFRMRNEPLMTAADVEILSNSLSVAGALIGATLFLWQSLRMRRESRRQRVLRGYLLNLAALERRIANLEASSSLDLESLRELQGDMLQLKGRALDDFTAGEFEEHDVLFELLASINAAQEHLGQLLMHVRESFEARAETEGTNADEVWQRAASGARSSLQAG